MGDTEAVCLCGATRISYNAEPIVKVQLKRIALEVLGANPLLSFVATASTSVDLLAMGSATTICSTQKL